MSPLRLPPPTYEQLCQPDLLRRAWRLVQQGGSAGGVDAMSLDEFQRRAGSELQRIGVELAERRYRFLPVRRTFIKKLTGGQRQLGIPTIADRVVSQAIRLVLEPSAEPTLMPTCFAYRPGRDVHQAIATLVARRNGGQPWFLESDIADFFDSISHHRLLDLLRQRVSDGALLQIVQQHLDAGARLGRRWLATRQGVAQGSPLSPLLSNLYLDPFDQRLLSCGWGLVRYADDFVICCRSREAAEQARCRAERELARLELRLNPAKTRILDARRESLEFLGFLVHPGFLWPAPTNVQRFRDEVARITDAGREVAIDKLIEQLNPLVRSFAHYYHHCHVVKLFGQLDAYIRGRLIPHLEQTGRRRPRTQDQWRALDLVSMTEILFRCVPTPRATTGYGWEPPRGRRRRSPGKPE
jgi:group II intron reverse transcriptase/maturase